MAPPAVGIFPQIPDNSLNHLPFGQVASQSKLPLHGAYPHMHKRLPDLHDVPSHKYGVLSDSFVESWGDSSDIPPAAIGIDFDNIFLTGKEENIACPIVNSHDMNG
jgi:hypothetical protein